MCRTGVIGNRMCGGGAGEKRNGTFTSAHATTPMYTFGIRDSDSRWARHA